MTILLNTDSLLFLLFDPAKLSEKAKTALDKSQTIYISAISLWEVGIMVQRKRLRLPVPLSKMSKMLQEIEDLEIIPVTEEILLNTFELKWDNTDPADRIIVTTAQLTGSRLLTGDQEMGDFMKNGWVW